MTATQSRIIGYGVLLFLLTFLASGCGGVNYVTPGGSVELASLADGDINELMAKTPAAQFPANLAVARVQASGYRSHLIESYGGGRYSIVTTREVEREEDFERISALPMVNAVAPLNRLLLLTQLDSIRALRTAAARLRADILLVYTFDTSFRVGDQKFGPLSVMFLGILPDKEVTVTTTASAALFDVRTEFLYGLAEASTKESQYAMVWNSSGTVDELRLETETKAFQSLVPEIEKTWSGILKQHTTAKIKIQRSHSRPISAPTEGLRYETIVDPGS